MTVECCCRRLRVSCWIAVLIAAVATRACPAQEPVVSAPGTAVDSPRPLRHGDRIELQLTADRTEGGRGSLLERFALGIPADARVLIWARSDTLDTALSATITRTDGSRSDAVLDSSSAGGPHPCFQGEVDAGSRLDIDLVHEGEGAGGGTVTVGVWVSTWSEAARKAAGVLEGHIREIREQLAAGRFRDAWQRASACGEDGGEDVQKDHLGLARRRMELGLVCWKAKAAAASRHHMAKACEALAAALPEHHPDLLSSMQNLAVAESALGNLDRARDLLDSILRAGTGILHRDDARLQNTRLNLADILRELGDLSRARDLEEAAVESLGRTHGVEHPAYAGARQNLAKTLFRMGNLEGARSLFREVLAIHERTLHADSPELQMSRSNLGTVLLQSGELAAARDLFQKAVDACERTLPEDHLDLQRMRLNLAIAQKAQGDFHAALDSESRALRAFEKTYPEGHPDTLAIRQNLGSTLYQIGDYQGARVLQESVLSAFKRQLPPDHIHLVHAKSGLASILIAGGDPYGAQVILDEVVESLERSGRTGDADYLEAVSNLGAARLASGDLRGARTHYERAVGEGRLRLAPGHPTLRYALRGLGAAMFQCGDFVEALKVFEEILNSCSRGFHPEHPEVLMARGNVAVALRELGRLDEALAIEEGVLDARLGILPWGDRDVQLARLNLAATLACKAVPGIAADQAAAGSMSIESARARCISVSRDIVRAQTEVVVSKISSVSGREAEASVAHSTIEPLSWILSLVGGCGAFDSATELVPEAFALSESTRGIALVSASLRRALVESERHRNIVERLRSASAALAGMAQSGGTRDEFHAVRQRYEEADRELVRMAASTLAGTGPVMSLSPDDLARALDSRTAALAFRRYERGTVNVAGAAAGGAPPQVRLRARECLGAFVMGRTGEGGGVQLRWIDLGPLDEIESAVSGWRAWVASGRRIDSDDPEDDPLIKTGFRLRSLVWDPLAEAVGRAERVIVAPDDVLHLVPLDALPLDAGGRLLGDRWRIETRVALREVLAPAPKPAPEGVLVALGGAAFDGAPAGAAEEGVRAVPGSGAAVLRGGPLEGGFPPLPHAEPEAREIAALFGRVYGEEARILLLAGRDASRRRLEEAASKARWLHVATHGWFAPDAVKSWEDAAGRSLSGGAWRRLGKEEAIRGMNPMLLCGLALAGANLAADGAGRSPGLLTGEELSTFDLSGCELVVLSACDTHAGERRAGQGVASLQRALHMAGARSAVTALWKVPDGATRELMLDFYRRLWVEGKPKSVALWESKQRLAALRDAAGHPAYAVRDWAAWVLTGEPD